MKRKYKLIALITVLTILFVCVMTGCSDRDYTNLGREFKPFDEEAYLSALTAEGENRALFSKDGVSEYKYIVYPDGIDRTHTAEDITIAERREIELYTAVKFMTSTLNEIITSTSKSELKAISYSEYNAMAVKAKAIVLRVDESISEIVEDGYRYSVTDDKIEICGTMYRGITNGIYDVLENKFGCMFISNTYDYIPSIPTIYLKKESIVINPDIKWRKVYAHETMYKEDAGYDLSSPAWYDKLKLNGGIADNWYNWCHTSFRYISPDEYFAEHPEYFSLYNGKRVYEQGPVSGQLCYTNEDVYTIIRDKVFDEMRENPDTHIWDVSQMDTWINRGKGCQCDKCKELDNREGTPMGSLLTFINRLAVEVKETFPNNYISTLAYNYSAEPPKNLRPEDNVIIKLCLMPGDVTKPLTKPRSKAGRDAQDIVEKWGKVANNVVIWDYDINFHNYLMPFPILDSLKETNEFYVNNNVYGIFHQLDYDKGGDMVELNGYIMAKLMWDKDTDVQSVYDRYMTLYYGNSAEYIAEYYDKLATNVEKSGTSLYIYSSVRMHMFDYLSVSNLNSYMDSFDKAIAAANSNETMIQRINTAKIGVLFAKGQQWSTDVKGRKAAINEFVGLCKANGIDSLYEGEKEGFSELDEYYVRNMNELNAMPYIVTAIVIGVILVITLLTLAIILLVNKKKFGKWSLKAKKSDEINTSIE